MNRALRIIAKLVCVLGGLLLGIVLYGIGPSGIYHIPARVGFHLPTIEVDQRPGIQIAWKTLALPIEVGVDLPQYDVEVTGPFQRYRMITPSPKIDRIEWGGLVREPGRLGLRFPSVTWTTPEPEEMPIGPVYYERKTEIDWGGIYSRPSTSEIRFPVLSPAPLIFHIANWGGFYTAEEPVIRLPKMRVFNWGGLYYVSEYEDAYVWDTKQEKLRIEWRAGWHWAYPFRDNVYIYGTPEKDPTFFALLDEVRLWDRYYDAAKENIVALASDEDLLIMAEEIYPKLVEAGIVESQEDIHEPHIRFVMFDKRSRYLYAGIYAWFTDTGVIAEDEKPMSDVVDINRFYRKGGLWADTPIAEILAHELAHAQGVPGAWWESQNTLIGMEIAATEPESSQWIGGVFGSLRALARDYAYWMMTFPDAPPKYWIEQRKLWLRLERETGRPWEAGQHEYDYGDPFVVTINNILQGKYGWTIKNEADFKSSPMPSLLSGEKQWGPAFLGRVLVFQTKRWEDAFNQMIMDTYQLPRDLQRYYEHKAHLRDEGRARMQQVLLEYRVFPYVLATSSIRLNEPLLVVLIGNRDKYPDDPGKWSLTLIEVRLDHLMKVIQKYTPVAIADEARR